MFYIHETIRGAGPFVGRRCNDDVSLIENGLKKMRKLLIGAALLSTALATPAFAQEAAPFTGPHIEALVG